MTGTTPLHRERPGEITLKQAWKTARELRRALKLPVRRNAKVPDVTIKRLPKLDDAHWYGFEFRYKRRCVDALVPGCPREWLDFPKTGEPFTKWPVRFYVAGNSWTFGAAVEILKYWLDPPPVETAIKGIQWAKTKPTKDLPPGEYIITTTQLAAIDPIYAAACRRARAQTPRDRWYADRHFQRLLAQRNRLFQRKIEKLAWWCGPPIT